MKYVMQSKGIEDRRSWMMVTMIVLLLLVSGAGAVSAAESSARHDIEISVGQVSMLDVHGNWSQRSMETDHTGLTTIVLTSSYGMTCNVPHTAIVASMVSSLPEGVVVRVRMFTTIGNGTGWRDLRGGSGVTVMTDPRGNEYNHVELMVVCAPDVDPRNVQLDISFSIAENRSSVLAG
jgi:hypothetical protein